MALAVLLGTLEVGVALAPPFSPPVGFAPATVMWLRNRRKNSARPFPEGASAGFLTGGSLASNDEEPASWSLVDREHRTPKAASTPESPVRRTWNKRSEAAKRRWADPDYRRRQITKRRAKAAEPAQQRRRRPTRKVETVLQSPTAAETEIWRSKADDINRWAQANQLRREKALRYKRDPVGWSREHLEAGCGLRAQLNNETFKAERRERRRLLAEARWRKRRGDAAAGGDHGS